MEPTMYSQPSTGDSRHSLPGAIWRRMRWWNRRRRVGGHGDIEDDSEQSRATRSRQMATIYNLSGVESGDEIAMKERSDERVSETFWTRQNGPLESNCITNSRCRSWNSSNPRPPRPPSGSFYADYQNPHELLETSAGGNTSRTNTFALGHTILDHRSDPMDTEGRRGQFLPSSGNAQEEIDDEHNQNEAEEESKDFLAPQPEQWRAFAPASRACRPTFVFDPAGKFSYYWSMVVSMAFLYNLWVIAYRFSFDEITSATRLRWFCLDYACDFIYLLDIAVQFRTGFLEDGVLQTNPGRLRVHYMNSTKFYMDCLSLLPLDFLYLSLGYRSILRCFRLTKVYKGYAFVEKTERHTNYPNVLRGLLLLHAVLLIFHWNACLVYALRGYLSFSSQSWDMEDKFYNYLNAYHLSCRTLIMAETLPRPKDRSKVGMAFVIAESVIALVIFAGVLGHVAGIVANISAARKQFQAQLDSVKTYMRIRKVPRHLQRKVVRWFDYWWSTKKYGNDGAVMECLPDKLKAEIAIHVHLDTLKRVEIFRNTEPGFLCELVLKLRPMLFSPGDYVCRKGEVGNEMYIVSIGRLHVLADDGKTVLATLKAGSYFGEISVLNMGTEGNRRTASVVSVGYSDLFCLSKRDIWEVLKDYPAARNRLELIAQKRLHQKLAHKAAMTTMAAALNRNALTTKLSDASQRRGSAPAMIHLSTAPAGSPSNRKRQNPFPSVSTTDYESAKSPNTTAPTSLRRLGPAAAFSRSSNPMKRPPAILAASSANSDEASTLCDIDDMDEETMAKSERTQLLLQTTMDSPSYGGHFANDALVVSPDANDPPPFIDDITVTIGPSHSPAAGVGKTERTSKHSNDSQTAL